MLWVFLLPKHSDLTDKQLLFIEYYCGADDGVALLNATKAYVKAGYSARTAHTHASKLLQNATIRARVDALFAEKALSRDQVLALVAGDASRSNAQIMAEAQVCDSDIVASSLVSGLITARTTARTNLMKAHGLFTENVNVSGSLKREIVLVLPDDE